MKPKKGRGAFHFKHVSMRVSICWPCYVQDVSRHRPDWRRPWLDIPARPPLLCRPHLWRLQTPRQGPEASAMTRDCLVNDILVNISLLSLSFFIVLVWRIGSEVWGRKRVVNWEGKDDISKFINTNHPQPRLSAQTRFSPGRSVLWLREMLKNN